jgi:2-keto-4-pentenoate hydratase/2-oxohepta-3-ene-1,7-dioic acid hydratase in catechol pathway
VANDVSARWWQKEGSGGQFSRGKSFDTFCPLGPLVPASELPDPQNLAIETILNGTTVQRANTSLMVFGVRFLVAELSRGMTLLAGTVVLTGTPAGVGAGRKPPLFLKDGDLIEVKIERVGHLKNRVREA